MKEKKKFKIKKMFKSRVFFFGLGLFLASVIGVSASTLLSSSDVVYDNSSSGMSATNLQDALDELSEKAKNAPECDSEGNCTVTCPSGTAFELASKGYKCRQLPVKENVVTSGAGLYADSTESGRYYYSGSAANTNNNIVFNGEPYRILAFETDGRIKIMKIVSIGQKSWNTCSSNMSLICRWGERTYDGELFLSSYLKSTWLPTQASGEDYQYLSIDNIWYTGNLSSANIKNIFSAYGGEITSTLNRSVGLISVSEYLKSKVSGNTFLSYSGEWWTITGNSSCNGKSWYISGNYLSSSFSGAAYGVPKYTFPVLYLKSGTSLKGSGTATDPYCISGSSCPTNLNFTQRAS